MSSDEYRDLANSLSVRIKRANTLGEQLGTAIQQWMKSNPLSVTPTIADDRLSWDLVVRTARPPLEKWGMLYGDAIHNLRAALDNLVWGLATASGTPPSKPRQVQFPIVEKEVDWVKGSRQIAELLPVAQHAIENIQPFKRGGEHGTPEQDPLLLLNWLSNTDKHRLAILPIVQPLELQHSFAVEFRTDEEARANVPPEVEMNADPFVDGTRLFRQVTKHPIVKIKGQYGVRGRVVVVDQEHGHLGVTESLAKLVTYVPQVVDYVLGKCLEDEVAR